MHAQRMIARQAYDVEQIDEVTASLRGQSEYVPQSKARIPRDGLSPDGKFVEIIELEDILVLGCQFHPE